jgi:hypothetical protein
MTPECGTSLVEILENRAQAQPAVQQRVEWRPPAWRSHFPEHIELINQLAGDPSAEAATIERSSIYEFAKHAIGAEQRAAAVREAFITIMIWGS